MLTFSRPAATLRPCSGSQAASMLKAFTQHPETVGESYVEHLGSASGYAATMAAGAVACLLHGIFPFAFQASGSRRIRELHHRMVTHRTAGRIRLEPDMSAWCPEI